MTYEFSDKPIAPHQQRYFKGCHGDGRDTKEIIERAEAELYALGEHGEQIRPNTFSDLLEELKKLRNALVDGAIEQYKRENNLR